MLSLLVSTGFQVLFHSPPGVLFTFPSRYWFTIGHQVVFSLGGWSPLLPARFLVSRGTLVPASRFRFSDTGLLPSLEVLSRTLLLTFAVHIAGPQPHPTVVRWFGLLRFRSPLLTKSSFISLPPGT